jgi:glycosyltransferase involved in cell wall biosynthesis
MEWSLVIALGPVDTLWDEVRILQVNSVDDVGGAAKVARRLFEGYRARGHESWMAVGVKRTSDTDIFAISHAPAGPGWGGLWWRLHDRVRSYPGRRATRVAHAAAAIASPQKIVSELRGLEDFDFPGTRRLTDLPPAAPDVVHLHNLHGSYFDLREIQILSRAAPLIVTLHDPWMFTGHCAYFLDSDGWQRGCGSCPHLDTYPPVRRDNTNRNWLRKRQIYRNSALFVAAPSRWLLEKAERSILAEGIVGSRLIPNGVDLSIFRPADKASARDYLGLPQGEAILLFSGFAPSSSSFKDLDTLRAAAEILGNRPGTDRMTLLVLGEAGQSYAIGRMTIRFAGHESDEARVALFYQAADIYVHAARVGAENHSLSVLEALASGLPVVATAVGGIPEQVKSLRPAVPADAWHSAEGDPNGVLTPPADPSALADAIASLIEDNSLLRTLSSNAVEDATRRFDLHVQVEKYLEWYRAVIGEHLLRSSA